MLHGRTGNGFLFAERAKGRYNNEFMARAALRAGLKDVTLHTMRHSFACKCLRNGFDLVAVQKLLGHKNLSSTMVYAHLQADMVGRGVADMWAA